MNKITLDILYETRAASSYSWCSLFIIHCRIFNTQQNGKWALQTPFQTNFVFNGNFVMWNDGRGTTTLMHSFKSRMDVAFVINKYNTNTIGDQSIWLSFYNTLKHRVPQKANATKMHPKMTTATMLANSGSGLGMHMKHWWNVTAGRLFSEHYNDMNAKHMEITTLLCSC